MDAILIMSASLNTACPSLLMLFGSIISIWSFLPSLLTWLTFTHFHILVQTLFSWVNIHDYLPPTSISRLPFSALYSLFKHFIYLFILERGEEKEKERERNINVWENNQSVASGTPLPGDLAHSPGMCPEQESKQQTFCAQAGAQSTEPHQPGHLRAHFWYVPFIQSPYLSFE